MYTLDFDPLRGAPYSNISLSDLARFYSMELIGPDSEISYMGALDFKKDDHKNVLTYLDNEKYIPEFVEKNYEFAIIPESMNRSKLPEDRSYLVSREKPSDIFTAIHLYIIENSLFYKVKDNIGDNCKISKKASIYPNVSIGDRCQIDDYVVLYPNTIIGDDVRIQANTVIGGDGFEIKMVYGKKRILKHCGGTIIGDNVEICSSCTIDRSLRHTFTFVGGGSKISNQVQIAHGAYLGEDCILTGHVQIANLRMGRGVFVSPSACCKPQINIGDYVFIGTGAVVIDHTPSHALVYGNPARQGGWVCKCRSKLHFDCYAQAICKICNLKYAKEGNNLTIVP